MIKIEKISPSSYSKFDFCQMQWFFNYMLKYRSPPNKKTVQGTIVHKVMECLAKMKKTFQETGKYECIDDCIGSISCEEKDWLKPSKLSLLELANMNKTRSNPYVYKSKCLLDSNHVFFGYDLVKELVDRSYNYFSLRDSSKWNSKDYDDCLNWSLMILEHQNGMYDPRKLDIVATESAFEFTIDKEWAKNGTDSIIFNGVIDLVTKSNDYTVDIIDWKTGSRKDWGTGEIKDLEYLKKDIQLLIYYYAAKKMYPDKYVMVTIFFVRDGGPHTIIYDEAAITLLEQKMQDRINEFSQCVVPKMCHENQDDDRCKKFCEFYKMDSPEIGHKNYCKFIHNKIKEEGIDKVIEKYKVVKE